MAIYQRNIWNFSVWKFQLTEFSGMDITDTRYRIRNYIIVAGKRAPISKLQLATRCYTPSIIFLVGNGNKWHLTKLVINQQGIHLTFDLPRLASPMLYWEFLRGFSSFRFNKNSKKFSEFLIPFPASLSDYCQEINNIIPTNIHVINRKYLKDQISFE